MTDTSLRDRAPESSEAPSYDNLFPSKRDVWLVVILWLSAFVGLGAVIPVVFGDTSLFVKLGAVTTVVIIDALILWILYGTFYLFEGEHLQIRSGPLRMIVPLADVTAVTPTRNPVSSPACSLDRLSISYGKNCHVMVSPRDKQRFIERLATECPQLD